MIPKIAWPASLPAPLIEGRSTQAVSPMIPTPMVSGRTRQRRAFTAVPVNYQMSWIMTSEQAALFERWFKEDLVDGTLWFAMPLLLPQGRGPWPIQFAGIYTGPDLLGRPEKPRWRYSAPVRQWLRAAGTEPLDPNIYRETESGEFRILED